MSDKIVVSEPRKFDKEWIEEIRLKHEAKVKAAREGTLILKENGNPEKST